MVVKYKWDNHICGSHNRKPAVKRLQARQKKVIYVQLVDFTKMRK